MIIKYFHDSNWTNDVASFLTKFVKRNKKKNLRLILTGGNSSKLINKQIIENLNTDCRLNIYLSDERCTKFANKESLNQTFFKRLNLNYKFIFFPILNIKKGFLESAKIYNKLINFTPDLILLSVAKDGHVASIFDLENNTKFKNIILTKIKFNKFKRISISKNYLKKNSKIILLCNSLARLKNFYRFSKKKNHVLNLLSNKKKLLLITKKSLKKYSI